MNNQKFPHRYSPPESTYTTEGKQHTGYGTDNQWIAYSTDPEGYFLNTFAVNGTGTYRAKMPLDITGADGSVDTIEYKYS